MCWVYRVTKETTPDGDKKILVYSVGYYVGAKWNHIEKTYSQATARDLVNYLNGGSADYAS